MDGFHLPDDALTQRGLAARKGAPETFAADAYLEALAALRRDDTVSWPVYDRAMHAVSPVRATIGPDVQVAITEGNYLLLDRDPWRAVRPLLDVAWYLDAAEIMLQQRLIRRHVAGGMPPDAARMKVAASDLHNARLVAPGRNRAAAVLHADGDGYHLTPSNSRPRP
jgi:pantothenate kinase